MPVQGTVSDASAERMFAMSLVQRSPLSGSHPKLAYSRADWVGDDIGRKGDSRGTSVVVVDDQRTGRSILEEIVRSIEGVADVSGFATPEQALEQIRAQPPDLIVSDYKMPGMDGVEFTRQVRAVQGARDVPIVVVTVVTDRDVRYRALDAGASDFLTRPIDQYECFARCRNLLTLRRQQRIIRSRVDWLEDQIELATTEIRDRERETLFRLAKAGEYRDQVTANHLLRIAKYARLIAEQLGMKRSECELIELAAPMHDIGKIGIPDRILLKGGKLSGEEYEIMKRHTVIGHDMLRESRSQYLQVGAVVALNHHERFDGQGYPSGLVGRDIPLEARIVAVADVFDALTSERPYKHAWSTEEAVAHLHAHEGGHFDPEIVQALIARLDEVEAVRQELGD